MPNGVACVHVWLLGRAWAACDLSMQRQLFNQITLVITPHV